MVGQLIASPSQLSKENHYILLSGVRWLMADMVGLKSDFCPFHTPCLSSVGYEVCLSPLPFTALLSSYFLVPLVLLRL